MTTHSFRHLSPWLALALAAVLPVQAQNTAKAIRLNNLVSQLATEGPIASGTDATVTFTNPRPGWIFVAIVFQPESSKTDVEIHFKDGSGLEGSTETSIVAPHIREGMWFLPAGDYEFRLRPGTNTAIASVNVRAIPELHYCRFPSEPVVEQYGKYDWDYLNAHVLPNVNTIVGNPSEESDAHITEWTRKGGKWIAYGSLPHEKNLTADQAFEYWTKNPGFTDPRLSGLIADEFQGRQNPSYPAWTEALRRMGQDPALEGKAFYGYCGGPGMYTRPQTRELVRTVFGAGYYMAWERYLHEMPTLEGATALLDSHLGQEMAKWRGAFPDCQKQMVLVSGLFTHGLSLDVQPEVDYKVWMDMQMQYLATNPAFDGLFGLHWWNSQFADEETLRWMARLFRHYAIEGRTELLSEVLGYRYFPALIENPDFAEGTEGWTVDAAGAEGSVRAEYMEHYGRLQGRYWHRTGFPDEPAGNTFLLTKRSAERPNVVSQSFHNLKPGALYSVKVVAADFQDITSGVSDKKVLPLSLEIEGAEVIRERSFVGFPNSRTSSPSNLPFDGERPAWFNLHRIVFRAASGNATLRISDWASPQDPGGPAGQELMINYVEAQPYFDG